MRTEAELVYYVLPVAGETWDMLPDTSFKALDAVGKDMDLGVLTELQTDYNNNSTMARFLFKRWRTDVDPLKIVSSLKGDLCTQPVIEATPLTRQRDFLHIAASLRKEPKTVLLLPSRTFVEPMPWRYSQAALLLPFAIDRVEKALLAEDLKLHLGLEWMPTNLMVHAITASSAQDPVDYQRLEFLGDSVLKLLASVALVDEHNLWHEGYLTGAKDRIVTNTTLSRVAIAAQLSRWIIRKIITGQKWAPRRIEPNSDVPEAEEKLSTKVLAVAHARQVRSGGNFDFAFQLQHGVDRAITGRTAGAVGAGEEVGVVAGQLLGSRHQFFMPSIGLGREELEAVATVLGHGRILGNSKLEGLCGSGLARECGGSVDLFINWHTAFASKSNRRTAAPT